MQHFDNQTFELVLVAAVAVAMLFQSIVLIVLFLAMRKAVRSASEQFESLRESVIPLIENSQKFVTNSQALMTRLGPKIEKTTDDLEALTHALRQQTNDVQSAANEIITRVRTQAGRLDGLMTSLLDSIDRASNFMTDAVNKPMRQLSAILASIKAAVESLRSAEPGHRSQPVNTPGDHDMFV
ncbi:MAG TPA: DUF948 domain-containing protein [Terriglobia bacterium]|nr:DUF948 domain-containing protein [Terriglobia bacterium]